MKHTKQLVALRAWKREPLHEKNLIKRMLGRLIFTLYYKKSTSQIFSYGFYSLLQEGSFSLSACKYKSQDERLYIRSMLSYYHCILLLAFANLFPSDPLLT